MWLPGPRKQTIAIRSCAPSTDRSEDEFVPLPYSKAEVETIARDLPRPNTILLGANATETRFKELSTESTEVIHLALHGYADVDYPDRSALIFAPEPNGPDDGLLQVREIRELHIRAKLVTLSACDTGVGPVGEADVANIVNAFIEAGADSVVSTLWELEDESTEYLMTIVLFQTCFARAEGRCASFRAVGSTSSRTTTLFLGRCTDRRGSLRHSVINRGFL